MTAYRILKTKTLGDLLLIANPTHLTGVYFADSAHAPVIQNDWSHHPGHPILRLAAQQIQEYLSGKRTACDLPLQFGGTEFQRKIWQQIARIPRGKTITYTHLAETLGSPNATRAAGTATGKNPLSIVIPCHRVVGKNGALCGYAGGLERKTRLLKLEIKHS